MNKYAGNDRRAEQAEFIRATVADALRNERSLKKNGDTWWEYVSKVITPERVLLVAVLVFNVGGRVQKFDTDLALQREQTRAMQERTQVMATQHEHINLQLADVAGLQKMQASLFVEQREQLSALAKLVGGLNAAQKLAVSRGEFNDAIQRQIVPRLDRLERSH